MFYSMLLVLSNMFISILLHISCVSTLLTRPASIKLLLSSFCRALLDVGLYFLALLYLYLILFSCISLCFCLCLQFVSTSCCWSTSSSCWSLTCGSVFHTDLSSWSPGAKGCSGNSLHSFSSETEVEKTCQFSINVSNGFYSQH